MSFSTPVALFNSVWEWGIVLLVALLLFGKRLPGVARSLGQGITEFKKGLGEGTQANPEDGDKRAAQPPTPSEQPRAKTEIDNTSV